MSLTRNLLIATHHGLAAWNGYQVGHCLHEARQTGDCGWLGLGALCLACLLASHVVIRALRTSAEKTGEQLANS